MNTKIKYGFLAVHNYYLYNKVTGCKEIIASFSHNKFNIFITLENVDERCSLSIPFNRFMMFHFFILTYTIYRIDRFKSIILLLKTFFTHDFFYEKINYFIPYIYSIFALSYLNWMIKIKYDFDGIFFYLFPLYRFYWKKRIKWSRNSWIVIDMLKQTK